MAIEAHLNPDKIFTKRDIVDYWLEIILLNWGYSIRGSDISAFLDALNKDSTNELSNELISALSNKWLVNGKLSNKAEPTFLLQCGYEKDFVLEQWKNNKEAIDSLARFYSNYREEQYNKESACLPFADTQKIRDKTIQSFAKAMEKIPFYQKESTLNMVGAKEEYISFRLDLDDWSNLLDSWARQLTLSFELDIRNQIINKLEVHQVNSYNLQEKEIQKIISFSPEFTTSNFDFKNYLLTHQNISFKEPLKKKTVV